jgi:transcriptional regulator with XRE-family HTH domain
MTYTMSLPKVDLRPGARRDCAADLYFADVTSMRASDFVGLRVKEIRQSRGWTAKDLAEKCAEAGAPEITAAVIANIETGRRDTDGRRRREVTIDETLALAYALGVPPVFLFIPLNGNERLHLTSKTEMDAPFAAAWVDGDDDALRHLFGEIAPRTDEDRARWAKWRQAARPLSLLRDLWFQAEIMYRHETGQPAADGLSAAERSDRIMFLARNTIRSNDEDFEGYAERIAKIIDWLVGLGFMPPQLPPSLVEVMREKNMLEVASPEELLAPDEGE